MTSTARRNFAFDAIDDIGRLTSLPKIGERFAKAAADLGFTSFGLNGLPPPEKDADPIIVMERVPEGFRSFYIEERFYLVDHIARAARNATAPFRFSEATYGPQQARARLRFMAALKSNGLGEGLIVPVGNPMQIPACAWLAGDAPELHDEALRVAHLIALFAASKAYAVLWHHAEQEPVLTLREREVLAWAAHGKSAWEIGQILHISKRTVDEHTQSAARKLGATNKTQAVAVALTKHLIDL
jgi:LuxR family quorum sensing-dependent transcriptional regulator